MTWLTHARFRKDLSAYLDGELSPRRAVTLESHVAACAACRSLLEDLRLASAALAELPQVDAPRSFALRPEQLMQPRPVHRAPTPGLMAGSRIAVAALTCALAAVVFVDLDGSSDNQGARDTGNQALSLPGDSYTAYDRATSVPKAVETQVAPGTPTCVGCGASSAGGSEAVPGLATAPPADAIGHAPSDDDGTSSGGVGVGSAPDAPTQVPSTPAGDSSEPAEGLAPNADPGPPVGLAPGVTPAEAPAPTPAPTVEPMPTLTPTPAPPTPGANADLGAATATTAAAARVQTTNGLPEGSPSALSGGTAQAQSDSGTDTLLLIEIGLAAALFVALAASAALAITGRRRL